MKIMTIGGATHDIFVHNINSVHTAATSNVLAFPEGAKLEIDALTHATGGGSTNAAVAFKRLGFEVEPFFKCANDWSGIFIKEELKKQDLSCSLICISQHQPTGTSIILPLESGDRTIFAYRGANASINPSDIPWTTLSTCNALYITSLSGDSSLLLPELCAYAKKKNLFIAHNPGGSQLAAGAKLLYESLEFIDVLILNYQEAQQLMQSLKPSWEFGSQNLEQFDINAFFVYMLNKGPQIVVVTNGVEGVYIGTPQSSYFHPSLPTTIINTIGAGDAFGSAFIAGVLQKKTIQDSMIDGLLNSTSVISFLDAKQGLLNHMHLKERSRAYYTSYQHYPTLGSKKTSEHSPKNNRF